MDSRLLRRSAPGWRSSVGAWIRCWGERGSAFQDHVKQQAAPKKASHPDRKFSWMAGYRRESGRASVFAALPGPAAGRRIVRTYRPWRFIGRRDMDCTKGATGSAPLPSGPGALNNRILLGRKASRRMRPSPG